MGFLFAVITGVPLGLLIGYSRLFERVFSPVIEMARPICPIAWLPVAIILFGLASFGSSIWGNASYRYDVFDQMKYAMVFIIWWGAFFPIVINTVDGVRGVKKLFIDAAKVLGLDEKGIFFRVIFPASLPSVMTGLRVGMGIAWMVIVAAEFFPGTTSGLGYMITTSHQVAEYEYAFASILAIGVTGLAINKLMMLLSVRVGKWEALER
ncbi:MAG: ABC transporter permease [Planctomycetota bacterium]|nr:ABC transporter permease [Planctomycetota bacterium]